MVLPDSFKSLAVPGRQLVFQHIVQLPNDPLLSLDEQLQPMLEAVTTDNKGPYIGMVNSQLTGLINIVVSKIDNQRTNMTANIRFLLHIKDGPYEQDWVFDAYGQQTKHIADINATCTSTGKAESYIMDLLTGLHPLPYKGF